ncbi:MAG: sigma-70 family RNA polymerase sigma factor [Acidobacteriota bacterium]
MAEFTHSLTSRVGFQDTEDLVIRLKAGDEIAFQEAFHLYKDLVYNLAFTLLTDKSEALDVTQEVFLTLHRKVNQFRGESTLKTWLYRVALNQAANRNRWWYRRRRSRTISLSLTTPENGEKELELISDGVPPDRQMLSSEVAQALRDGLDQLNFEQRAAVTLRDVHGLSYEEIAGAQGVHVGTVKSRIARGRTRLREHLRPYWEGRTA